MSHFSWKKYYFAANYRDEITFVIFLRKTAFSMTFSRGYYDIVRGVYIQTIHTLPFDYTNGFHMDPGRDYKMRITKYIYIYIGSNRDFAIRNCNFHTITCSIRKNRVHTSNLNSCYHAHFWPHSRFHTGKHRIWLITKNDCPPVKLGSFFLTAPIVYFDGTVFIWIIFCNHDITKLIHRFRSLWYQLWPVVKFTCQTC